MPLIVNVCGNIASGKSTLVASLVDRFSFPAIVEETNQVSLFESYCDDPPTWAGATQMQFMTMKITRMLGALRFPVTILDRSIHEDYHVFANVHRKLGNIGAQEFDALSSVFRSTSLMLRFREINIFVSCSEAEQARRISRRSIKERSMLGAGYLNTLRDEYSRFIRTFRVDYHFDSERDSISKLFDDLDLALSSEP